MSQFNFWVIKRNITPVRAKEKIIMTENGRKVLIVLGCAAGAAALAAGGYMLADHLGWIPKENGDGDAADLLDEGNLEE